MKIHSIFCAVASLAATFATSRCLAQPVSLPSTWGQYDLQKQVGYSAGLLSLSGQSSTGFTAMISSNGINPGADSPGFPSKSQYLPRVYTFFPGQPITNLGSRVTVAFDVLFNNLADQNYDVGFRMSMGDTNCNNAIMAGFEMGPPSGQVILLRYDITISQDTNWFNPDNGNYLFCPPEVAYPSYPTNCGFGSFCDAGATMASTGTPPGAPNGVSMAADTTNKHHIRFSVERTPVGLQTDVAWSNSAGTNVTTCAGAPVPGGNGDDHNGLANTLPWSTVNVFGLCLFGTGANEHFFGYNPGSYTVSNLKVYSGFYITAFTQDAASRDATLTWESSAADTCQYVVQRSPNLKNWTSIATNTTGGYLTSYTDAASPAGANYYRVQKMYP